MYKLIIGVLVGSTLTVNAAEYEMFFLSKNGNKISNEEAIIAAANGETVFKCQSQEFKVSKSGTSISVKNVKKPKVEKN